jgi:hypothetical protein
VGGVSKGGVVSVVIARSTRRLTDHLRYQLRKQGWTDRYDADFITSVLMEWLAKNDSALTGGGVKRFRR